MCVYQKGIHYGGKLLQILNNGKIRFYFQLRTNLKLSELRMENKNINFSFRGTDPLMNLLLFTPRLKLKYLKSVLSAQKQFFSPCRRFNPKSLNHHGGVFKGAAIGAKPPSGPVKSIDFGPQRVMSLES